MTVDEVRAVCLALPSVEERTSHSLVSWWVGGRQFCVHQPAGWHGKPEEGLWCAAPEGEQDALLSGEPEHYYRPPYVGHRGWVGVRLDTGLDPEAVAAAVEEAHATIATKR